MLGSSRRVPWEWKELMLDQRGRYIVLKGLLRQVEVTMVGIYVPISEQAASWEELYSRLSIKNRGELLILGDFNMVVDS